MSKGRDAIDTIIGYYYQFDYYILQLLNLSKDTDTVTIEGIEDVDISEDGILKAIQCKYYAKTEYNHSKIASPIRLMLKDYALRKRDGRKLISYMLYGHYESGHEKYPKIFDIDFLKSNICTYTQNKVKHTLYTELNLDDSQLEEFLNLLVVDINAKSYEEQEKQIFTQMCKIFKCDMFEAEYYYYNNALRIVKDIATEQAEKKRVLSKHEFLGLINHKGMLFDSWYIEFKGIKQYCKDIKTQYFTKFNISPFERFFLIQYDELSTDQEVADLLLLIAKRWSKISQRTSKPFCPFVYIHGISAERLISIKNIITNSGVNICDGYNYLGAKYNADMMLKKTNYYIGIQLKILNEKQYLNSLLKNASGVKEIYQFYIDTPFWENNQYDNVNTICSKPRIFGLFKISKR